MIVKFVNLYLTVKNINDDLLYTIYYDKFINNKYFLLEMNIL